MPERTAILRVSLALLLAGCAGGAGTERHTVRGVFVGPRYSGEAVALNHEKIPGMMDAMRMEFRLGEAVSLDEVQPGDKVVFDLVVRDDDYWVENIRPLPDTTTLHLAGAPAVNSTAP